MKLVRGQPQVRINAGRNVIWDIGQQTGLSIQNDTVLLDGIALRQQFTRSQGLYPLTNSQQISLWQQRTALLTEAMTLRIRGLTEVVGAVDRHRITMHENSLPGLSALIQPLHQNIGHRSTQGTFWQT